MASVMIVVKAIDAEVARQQLPYHGYPGLCVLRPIDHEMVPLLRDRLHGLSVAEPTDIGEIAVTTSCWRRSSPIGGIHG